MLFKSEPYQQNKWLLLWRCDRALVKAWTGLGREEGGNPSALFPRAWASTQSNYQNQLRVSYLPTQQ